MQLGVTRAALSRVLVGRAAISPLMGLRLENGGRADAWLAQQTIYDLWPAREAAMPKVTPVGDLQNRHPRWSGQTKDGQVIITQYLCQH